jgi:trehalose 6-phosphate synthase/phosphatase
MNKGVAAGEARTDEILYQALPENSFSIKIGKTRTDARYIIKDQDEYKNLLKELKKTGVLV